MNTGIRLVAKVEEIIATIIATILSGWLNAISIVADLSLPLTNVIENSAIL